MHLKLLSYTAAEYHLELQTLELKILPTVTMDA